MTPPDAAAAPERASLADCAGLTLLGDLAPALLERILARCAVRAFAAGEVILRRGDANRNLHFLLDGEVHIRFDLAERGAPIVVGPKRMFGEMSVIDELPVSAFVLAHQPCRVLLVPAEVFWEEVVTVPGAPRLVMRSLSGMLRANATALTEAVRERMRHEALERELALAHDIQMGMLQHPEPWFPGQQAFAIAAQVTPAKLVGGDFYDAFLLDGDRLVVAIGDVAGKGISAAMFMVRALTLLRSAAGNWVSLAHTVGGLNDALAKDNDASMFLTLFMAVVDLRTGALDYANFGHPPPLLVAPDGRVEVASVPAGMVVGIMESAHGAFGQLQLPPGSTLLLYSDGITEALNPVEELFGEPRLRAALAPAPPAALVASVVEAVNAFAASAEQADDMTLLALRWTGLQDG